MSVQVSVHEVERRTIRQIEIRTTDKGPRIVGYAAVFNSLSEDLGFFRETILPTAFDRALKEGHDVRALVNHNPDLILGRTKAGTLALSVDDHGLKAEINPPDTQAGRDIVTSIGRGDLDGMSFGFRTIKDAWTRNEDPPIRELHDLELLDVSVVAFPAYPATQVSARALQAALELRVVPSNVSREKAGQGEAWSAPTLSDFTDQAWGDLSDAEKRRIAGHFAYSSEMPPDAFGSLKLPHHRASDGYVVFRGVAAAAARLNQTSIPSGQVAAVKAHLAAHYHQFDLKAPWEEGASLPMSLNEARLKHDRSA